MSLRQGTMRIYEVGRFQLNVELMLLSHEGRPVALGPKVVETLLALVEHPGEVVGKGLLVDRIWPDGFVEESNLAQNVHILRKTFSQHGGANPIETIPRRGYRLTALVRLLGSQPHAIAPRLKRSFARSINASIAGTALVLTLLSLVASNGLGHDQPRPGALSKSGARFYQTGLYDWNLRTRDGVQKSMIYFAKVIDTDPESPVGYAALADANVAMGDYCYGTHQPEVYFARADAYAQRALALDPHSPQAHAALGYLALERKDLTGAQSELRRAIASDPSYGPAQEWLGIALLIDGRSAEGIGHLKIAAALDPLSVSTIAWLGTAAYMEKRFDDAILFSHEALELSPRRVDVLAVIGQSYVALGDIEHAIAAFKRFGATDEFYRPEAAALLANAYALGDRRSDARAQLSYARAHAGEVNPSDLAAAAAALGDRSGAVNGPAQPRNDHARHTATFG